LTIDGLLSGQEPDPTTLSTMTISDVQAVLSFYALQPAEVQRIEPLANAGGWSGSRLWRIHVRGAEIPVCQDSWQTRMPAPRCLRRWPREHPTKERLRLIHDVLKIVAAHLPILASPLSARSGEAFVEQGGYLWELTNWLPGAADYHARPSRERLRAAMTVLAKFHELAAPYESQLGPAPAILDRQRQWAAMRDNGVAEIHRSLGTPLGNALDDRAARLLPLASDALHKQAVIESLNAAGELPLQPAIRDIHRDHVLFTGDEVTGLIDFGALRIDTPLADVARLVGSLAGDDAAVREFAFDAYSELRPLGADERRLIDVLDYSGVVLGALNWLTWLYVERREMGPVGPIVKRLEELLVRLDRRVGPTSLSA
jgi:Ser/Thr protein kinase RdoA (MazF antagonist)